MKRFYISFFFTLLIAGCPALAGAEPAEPTAADVLAQLFHHSGMQTDNLASCKDQFRNMHEKDRTLGRYLAEVIANLEEEGDNKVRFSCQPVMSSGARWSCDLDFAHSVPGREVMFQYGVRVLVGHDGLLQMKSLECMSIP